MLQRERGRNGARAVVRQIRSDAKAAELNRIVVKIILRHRRAFAPAAPDVRAQGGKNNLGLGFPVGQLAGDARRFEHGETAENLHWSLSDELVSIGDLQLIHGHRQLPLGIARVSKPDFKVYTRLADLLAVALDASLGAINLRALLRHTGSR